MKRIITLIFILAAFNSYAQYPGPYSPQGSNYDYRGKVKHSAAVWFTDSAFFAGITRVPDLSNTDSSSKAANTKFIKQQFGTYTWKTSGNLTPVDPTTFRLGFKDSTPLIIMTNNDTSLVVPAAGINRSYGARNKVVMIDTLNKDLYYTDINKSFSDLAYGGTATWTFSTTAPSGTPVIRYSWAQINKDVTATFTCYYPTAGTGVTAITLTLPTDMPLPKEPTGTGVLNDVLYPGTGFITTNYATEPTTTGVIFLKVNAADTGYEIKAVSSSIAARYALISINYKSQ